MTIEIGQIIDDKYRIVRLLGEGGMGAVYEGENTLIRRRVAIKVLSSAFATNAEQIARFEREAQAAGQIGNDHILEVLDLGSLPNGNRYMVLEYLDGETLLDRINGAQRLTPEQVVPLARQVLSALDAAHAAGIIHRDLKPENIFILREKAGRPDFVKLIDFGVSKFANLTPGAYRVTRAGTLIGTPAYMAPEQARGIGEADVRSDIYAIGVILYESVTGKLPFDGCASFHDLLFKIALTDPPAPRVHVPTLDPEFERIIKKAMARDREQRYESVQDLNDALEDWATERHVPLSVQAPRTPRRLSIPDDVPKRAPAETQMDTVIALPNVQSYETISGTEPTLQNELLGAASSQQLPVLPARSKKGVILGAAAALLVMIGVAVAASLGSASSKAVGMTPASAPPPPSEPAETAPLPSTTILPLESAAPPEPEPPTSPLPSAKPAATGVKATVKGTAAKPTASAPVKTTTRPPKASAKPRTPAATDFGY